MSSRVQEQPQKHDEQWEADQLYPAWNADPRRPADGVHARDATAVVVPIRPPDWDWDVGSPEPTRLNRPQASATVPAMSPPVVKRRARTTRRRHLERERRLRRLAVLVVIAVVALVTLLLSAFGGSGRGVQAPAPASAARLLPAGPPAPEIVARLGSLHLQLPVSQSRVTAIGYGGGSEGALALSPLGAQANENVLKRVLHAIVGGSSAKPRWYELPEGSGTDGTSLEVGAAAGTDVYAPVDGIIVAIDKVVINGSSLGSQIDIQPTGAPSLVVSVSHVSVDPALTVGSTISAGGTRLGSVVDFSHVERQALARYTNDAGNHVAIEVHPVATPSLD